jgi:glycerol-3-phosphate dehydrogenase
MFISQGRDEPLRTLPEYSKRELAYIAQKEKVVHLDDFLLRRSLLAMLGRLTRDNVEEIAWVLGEALNWTSERREEEVERTREILKDRHGVVLS